MRFIGLFIFTLLICPFAHAQDTMDMPTSYTPRVVDAAPVMRLTPDKSEIVELNQEAASVIVGNPAHINVILDTPTKAIVVPRASGSSHFSVIGRNGDMIMQRHVVVGAPKAQGKNKYVRIRRSCGASSNRNCQETSVYFCPDSCHEVQENVSN